MPIRAKVRVSPSLVAWVLGAGLPLCHAGVSLEEPSVQYVQPVQYSPLTQQSQKTALTTVGVQASIASTGMKLSDVFEQALPLQPRLKAAQAALRAAQAQVEVAQAQQRPNLTFSASRLKNSLDSTGSNLFGQTTSHDNYYSANQTLTLRQPIYRPALAAAVRSSQSQALATELQKEQEVNVIASYTAGLFFDLLMAQSQQAWAAAQVQTRQTLMEAAQQALVSGNGTVTEVDDARARFDLALADQADALVYAQMASQQLSQLLNTESVPSLLAPADRPATNYTRTQEQPAQYWIDRAIAHNPELQQLTQRQLAAREDIARAKAAHMPALDLLVQRSRSGNENVTRINSSYDNTSVGLQLNMPLYAGGQVSAQVRQAVAEHDKAVAATDAAKQQISAQVFKEYRAMVEHLARHAALQQVRVSARTVLQSTQMALQAGIKTQSDVALALLQVATAELESQKSRYQAVHAKLRLGLLSADNSHHAAALMQQADAALYGQ